jgi:hypothetical protein
MTPDRVHCDATGQSLSAKLRPCLRWPSLNTTPLSRMEVILAVVATAFLLVPEGSDLGYRPYSIEVLLAACTAALLMAILVILFRSLPMMAAIFIGMAFGTFLELYFFDVPLFALLATIFIPVSLITNLREGVIHFFAVFSLGFAGLVVASHNDTLLSPRGPGWDKGIHAGSNNRPAVIHVVLDQFMGSNGLMKVAGVPETEVAALEDFFTRRGFRVFRNARSASVETQFSFNNFLTGKDEANVTEIPPAANLPYSTYYLKTNSYFDKYRDQHYMVHSVYSQFLRLCPSVVTDEVSCRVYTFARRGSLASRHSSPEYSLWLFAASLAADLYSRSNFYHWLSVGLNHFKGSNVSNQIGPVLVSLELLDQLQREIDGAKRGEVYFAHLLLPHQPIVLNGSCQLGNDLAQTLEKAYWAQVKCMISRLDLFLKAVETNPALNDAIILFHGDHGAHFNTSDPPEGLDEDAPTMLDFFNAFVAFRAPGYEPGVDDRRIDLAEVIRWELRAAGVELPRFAIAAVRRHIDATMRRIEIRHTMREALAGKRPPRGR